jgi:hypothetical protein
VIFSSAKALDILSQCLLASLVIPIDAVPCINAEPAVVPVHELMDEIISYPALAFQHGQNPGPENFLKLPHLALGKYIKSPVFSEKAVSDYGMKMRMEPDVISKDVNDHHKVWNSFREVKHSTKKKSQDFPWHNGRTLSELDHLFGMVAWAEPPFLATE